MTAFMQAWIGTVIVGFCWTSLSMIQNEFEVRNQAADRGDAATLRWTGTFRSYLESHGDQALHMLPPRSDHQRGSDPLVCEMANEAGFHPAESIWSCR